MQQTTGIAAVKADPGVLPGILRVGFVACNLIRRHQKSVIVLQRPGLSGRRKTAFPANDIMNQIMVANCRPPRMPRAAALDTAAVHRKAQVITVPFIGTAKSIVHCSTPCKIHFFCNYSGNTGRTQ